MGWIIGGVVLCICIVWAQNSNIKSLQANIRTLSCTIKEKDSEINRLVSVNDALSREKDNEMNHVISSRDSFEAEVKQLEQKLRVKEIELEKVTEQLELVTVQLKRSRAAMMVANQRIEELSVFEEREATREAALCKTLEGHRTAFPYIAGMISDYLTLDLEIMARSLDWGSNIERAKKVKSLRELRLETKSQLTQAKIATYELAYLLQLYPALEDILNCDFRELDFKKQDEIPEYDPVRNYLSKEQWLSLSPSARNQRALDNYITSHTKTNWQIGRDYELFVGHHYTMQGYNVEYFGSNMGLEDLGRDLICTSGEKVRIVQCKYWSKEKTIHEKHIFQLYGTTITYILSNDATALDVRPVFITNIKLSPMAKRVAAQLRVDCVEMYALGDFPRIKCNVGRDEYGNVARIYHLPMDQQYDSVKIQNMGDCFAFTVQEAESKGFRRAYRWHGN